MTPSEALAHHGGLDATERGAVFTKREVVDFILDLVRYTTDSSPQDFRLLEPSFGEGDFLVPAVERLLKAYLSSAGPGSSIRDHLGACIRAVEIHEASFSCARRKLEALFSSFGVNLADQHALLDQWLKRGDFLLMDFDLRFTHVIGNPPYVRQELIPEPLLQEYRRRYKSIYDRADLYVPFIERGLQILEPGGALGFICPDRWTKNRYGAALRDIISKEFHLEYYVDLLDTQAFLQDVSAYPSISVIRRERPAPTRIVCRPRLETSELGDIAAKLIDPEYLGEDVKQVAGILRGREPWALQSSPGLALVRRLESEFPTVEESGCKVGIGVATGADKVYIAPFETLHVEEDRKLPLVTTKDLKGGQIVWAGLGVLNPFGNDGALVDLDHYPLLKKHMHDHEDCLRARNCAQRSPGAWYRTIDRIYPELVKQPKLLIPDIKGAASIVYDEGAFYPHHNLYYITSTGWDLRALQTVLRSGLLNLFVTTYSTKMRGGYLRFQAQYLRRFRLPIWADVPEDMKSILVDAHKLSGSIKRDKVLQELYQLTNEELAVLRQHGAMDKYGA
ncbi:MAG: Eco57I restriction-modification methylase domain-containing protein [Candidatus Hydrogenedentes bacterium]|nr:Eco57I restriction-modification methylase domain-containing protein [Candidatus Hydrogenedentota bacterium]